MDFNAKLFEIEYNEQAPPINLHIQSTGGSLLDSLYISDFINNLKTPINTYVDGYVASAASLISVMGDKRYMTKNSMILILLLASGGEGKYQELDDNMKNLQQMMKQLGGMDPQKMMQAMGGGGGAGGMDMAAIRSHRDG